MAGSGQTQLCHWNRCSECLHYHVFFPPKGCASEEEISHIEEPIQQILLSTYICREIFPALVRRMDSPGTSIDRLWSRGVNRYTDISKVL